MLPDGYSWILRSYVCGPSGFWTMASLRYTAKFDPFLSLDCAPTPSTLCPPSPPPGRNPRKGRDQILPSGNLDLPTLKDASGGGVSDTARGELSDPDADSYADGGHEGEDADVDDEKGQLGSGRNLDRDSLLMLAKSKFWISPRCDIPVSNTSCIFIFMPRR